MLAKGPTSEEFVDVLKQMKPGIDKAVREHPAAFLQTHHHNPDGPLLSYDNDAIHRICPSKAGFKADSRIPLPANSPDMHKVIEHVVANMKRWADSQWAKQVGVAYGAAENGMHYHKAPVKKKGRSAAPKRREPLAYQQVVRDIFFQNVVADSVRRDVSSLHATYNEIVRLNGGWPEAKHR